MLALLLCAVFIGLTIWGFFNAFTAGVSFILVVLALAGWLLLANIALRSRSIRNLDLNAMSAGEIAIFRKYALYFGYPYQARQYSSALSIVQGLSVVWMALLLWRSEWILAACFVGVFFAATNMAPFLNPGNFLRHHDAKGNLPEFLQHRLALLEVVEDKVMEARRVG